MLALTVSALPLVHSPDALLNGPSHTVAASMGFVQSFHQNDCAYSNAISHLIEDGCSLRASERERQKKGSVNRDKSHDFLGGRELLSLMQREMLSSSDEKHNREKTVINFCIVVPF